ncbi:MAG: RsiV family protein [Bacteroidota bacterium]
MKKFNLFICALVLITSCDERPKTTSSEANGAHELVAEDTIPKDSTWLVKGKYGIDLKGKLSEDEEESNFFFVYSFYKSTSELALDYQRKVNQLILRSMKYEGLSQVQLKDGENLSEKNFKTHINDIQTEYSEALKENSEMFDWSYNQSIEIDTSYRDFVTLTVWKEGYTGGAHGSVNSMHTLVSKSTGKELKLEDVFQNVKKLELIAEDYFRAQNEMSQEDNFEEAGYWFEEGFKLNNNFYFSEKNLVFQYNQYEIAPYVMGMPSIEIPISKIKSLLKISLEKSPK